MKTTDKHEEVYRSVNKYIDFTTGEEFLEYGRVYTTTGPARSYATQMRSPKRYFRSTINDLLVEAEYSDTWCEVASVWSRV